MQLVITLFLCVVLSYIEGQTTEAPNYICDQNSGTVEITLSSSFHSAWNPTSNCSLQQCSWSSNNNNSCLLSSTPCYEYHTLNNSRYCAPGILCSILESCNNITYTCSSNDSVCVINSCCSPQPVCLPLAWTDLCISASTTSTSTSTSTTASTTTMTTQNPQIDSVGTGTLNLWMPLSYSYTAATSANLTLNITFQTNNRFDWYIDDVSIKDSTSLEMLRNGNFESTPALTGWAIGASGSCISSSGISTTYSNSSSQSYYDSCDSETAWISQSFTATSGRVYTISLWYYLDHHTNGNGPGTKQMDITMNY